MARKSRKNMTAPSEPVYKFKMYDTAIYIRLSVEDRKKRGDSIETQKSIMENFIAIHPELRLIDVYIDNGTTGTNFERPGFKRMIDDVENGKVNCVIVKDLSRLGRNAIDTGYYIEKYFPTNKVRFISVNDDYDSNDPKNKNGGIIIPLKNMINEAYSLDISRKIRTQAHQSMKAGDFIGARPPYGYSKAPYNCHKLIINEETAPVVKQIFEWAYNKIGLSAIVKRLNDAHILPPSNYAQSKGIITHENLLGSGKWQTRTLIKILSDEVYVGDMVQGKTKSVNHVQLPVDEKDWIRVKNTHEPIISREMFEAVKAYREQIAADSIRREKIPYTENIFKGKIFCECCGKSLHRQRNIDVYYYHCISNDRISKGVCKGIMIKEDDLRSMALTILQKKTEVLIGRNIISARNVENKKGSQNGIKAKISELHQEIEANRKYLKSLYESLVNDIITEDEYFIMKADYETKITSAMDGINDLENEQTQFESKSSLYCDIVDNIKKLYEDTGLTTALVDKLIDRITVDNDKKIKISLCFENEFSVESEVCVNE